MAQEAYLQGQYGASHYPEQHGLSVQYGYDHHSQNYYSDRRSQTGSPYVQSLPLSSPPTPVSNHSDVGRRTRSGRSIVRNDSPYSGHQASPPRSTRKKKGAIKEKNKTPKLTAPLSVLTKDMTNVPVRDMEAWVNRSVEERMKEVEKRNGYVTRPMNSFMLYRSAFADRTKMWCLHNNHQVVSSVSGESWPLESSEVREFYNELAKTERANHQNAHPNYKFSPSKPGAPAVSSSKKRKIEVDEDSEPSDLDDPEWGASNGVRTRPAKRPGRGAGYPPRANLGDAQQHFSEPAYHRQVWDHHGQPVPNQMLFQPMHHPPQHYYPSPTMQHHHIEMMPQQPDPYSSFGTDSFGTNQSLIGLPGGSHTELLGLNPNMGVPMMEHQLDPLLLAYDNRRHTSGLTLDGGLTLSQHTEYDAPFNNDFAEQSPTPISYPHAEAGGQLVTCYRPQEYHPTSQSPSFDGPSEFEKLWDEHHILERRKSEIERSKLDDHGNSPKW